MECTSVQPEVDVEVYVVQAWKIFLSLTVGIFGGVCITIIVLLCWKKVFKKGKNCQKICCYFCVSVEALKRRMTRTSLAMSGVILIAWKDEISFSDEDSELASETTTVLVESDGGNERILRHDGSIVEETGSDTESTTCERLSMNLSKQRSLAEILSQPTWETRNAMTYGNETNALLKIEADFVQQKSELFLFMLDCVTTQIVAGGQASEAWKESLKEYCQDTFQRTKERMQSHSVANFTSLQPQMPETFQINMNGVIITLFEYLHKSLESQTKVTEMEVDVIVNEFQESWSTFEKAHSDVYLKQIEELGHNLKQQALIVEVIEQENSELISEMVKHVDKHKHALEQLRIKDRYYDIDLPKAEDRLAPEIEEIWRSALDHFQMDLRRQKMQLSMELREELDVEKKKLTTNLEQDIQTIQEAVMNEDGSMEDYVDKYCKMILSKFREQSRLEQLELQLTANGFSSLTEAVGNRYLKMGVESEGELYADYLARTNWVEPSMSKLISQHQQNLTQLRANLKDFRKMQHRRLQAQLNKRKEDASESNAESLMDDVMNMQQESIKEVIELQADLSEMECKLLLEQCIAQQNSFQVQLELNRIKQERRLEQQLRKQRANLSKNLKEVNINSTNSEGKLSAVFLYNQEEKQLLESHQKSMEELRKKMREEIESAKKEQELFFQQKIEHLRGGHERRLLLANNQEKAIKSLKNKLLNRLANGAKETEGERIIKEHQINKEVLEETIKKNKLYQQQVLQQKLQARKLDREKCIKKGTQMESYRPGSAKRFAANTLVSLLYEVRHKRAMKEMEVQLTSEGQKVKTQIEKKFKIHSKLELQLREAEMIANLATALNMTRAELELELKKSVQEQGHSPDSEYGILLSKSVLRLFDGCDT